MNDSMVDRLDDHEPVTITEALEIPQPRAVGSPLPRGNGNRVTLPPSYAELEERAPLSHPGPILAPVPPSQFAYAGPILAAVPAPAPAPVSVPEPFPLPISLAPEHAPIREHALAEVSEPAAQIEAEPASIPEERFQVPAQAAPAPSPAPSAPAPKHAAPDRPRASQARSSHSSSTLQKAAGVIRQALPIVHKLLPLMDGNFGTAISNILSPPPPPPPTAPVTALVAPPPAPPKLDLTPLKESVAELQVVQKELQAANKDLQTTNLAMREQLSEQNNSLKRVVDHLELVREATDRNTLEQQELMEDLKSMGSRVNVVAAIAIGLLAVSLLVNIFLYMHVQRVLP